MINIILHIGRHKTGTSSLQRFLFENPRLLQTYGLVYPSIFIKNIAHHILSERFRSADFNKLDETAKRALIERSRSELCASMDSEDVIYIISSEAFQNADPLVIREVFDPKIFNVTVVCYFRDQISYLASAYNQRIHATDYSGSIYEYYRDFFRANYLKFTASWAEAFDSIVIRKYERRTLYQGDLICDFFKSVFGIELTEIPSTSDGNPSLSEKFVYIKKEINRRGVNQDVIFPGRQSSIYRYLSDISESFGGEKFRVPPFLALTVFLQHYKSNQKFFRKYIPGYTGFSLKPFWESFKNLRQANNITQGEVDEVIHLLRERLDHEKD